MCIKQLQHFPDCVLEETPEMFRFMQDIWQAPNVEELARRNGIVTR